MGSLISYLWWGGHDPDAVDPKSGLSRKDIYYVRKSWKVVSNDGVASGSELLIRYFKEYPQYKNHFKMFKNIPTDDLRGNIQFNAHALNIITSLSSVVDNLHEPDLAIVMCRKIGSNHRPRKVEEKHFNDLKGVLVKMFTDDLHFSEATMKSWVRAVTFIYTNIFAELTLKVDN